MGGARRAEERDGREPDPGPADAAGQGPVDPADSGAQVARLHPAKRLVLGAVGALLLVVGIALLVLPGPGMLLVLAGLVLLSRAIPAVARYVDPVRDRAMQATEASVANWWRVAGTALAGAGLLAAGVVWGAGLVPGLPFTGWSTGSSLILSGLILFGLLLWSYRRVHSRSWGDGPGARPGDPPSAGPDPRT